MSTKTAGVGHFTIPTAPAAGVSCTSGAANVFTTTYVQLIASTSAALYITGIYVEEAAVSAATYIAVQLATGGAGSETIIGQYLVAPQTGSTVTRTYRPIYPPIPVATATRIAVKTADSVGAAAKLISLECIAQSNVVDMGLGVTVATNNDKTGYSLSAAGVQAIWDALTSALTVANSIGKLIVTNLDALISSRMATYTQPTGFLATTFPGTVASPTNITAASGISLAANQHVIVDSGTVTTLTNLPAITANWLTAAGINAGALNGKGDWLLSSGYTAPDNAGIATLTSRLSAARALLLDNLDAAVSSRSTYAGADTAGTTSLLSRLTALRAGNLDNLDALISSRSTYAGGDTAGTTTLLGRVTAIRAGNLDNLDALVSSRFATAGYTAPDNASITAIKSKTDSLVFTVANKLDVNALVINGVTILGDGSATPFHV